MVDLLDDMGNLGVHRLLVGGHSLKLGGQLIDGLTKSFINLGLGHYEALHETLQVEFELLWRLRGWAIRSSILKPRRLQRTLELGVRVLLERIGMALSIFNVGSGVGIILW